MNKATEKAEKVVNVINAFAKDLKSNRKALAAMSLPRRRWVMAIRRVLQINGVAKTTRVLEALAKKQAEKSQGEAERTGKSRHKHARPGDICSDIGDLIHKFRDGTSND